MAEEQEQVFVNLTPSTKKSYSPRNLGTILCAIDFFGYINEGEGGQTGNGYGGGYCGSGLRHPSMPFYEKPFSIRRSMLKSLATLGYIKLSDSQNNFKITEEGKEVAKKIYEAGYTWFLEEMCYNGGNYTLKNQGFKLLTETEVNKHSNIPQGSNQKWFYTKAERKVEGVEL